MKAEELRIGNFYDHNGFVNEVHPNTIEEVWISERSWVKPIPLTEEWLLKFGFSCEVKVGSEIGTDGVEFRVYHFDVLRFNTNHGWWYKVQRINDTPLEYVHQLQNFYFALTGKELTLKQ
jgi:hypothetical protein